MDKIFRMNKDGPSMVEMGMKTNEDPDRSLLVAAQAGDQEAFGKLVEQYRRLAYASAFAIVRNREEALDLAQEAFVRAYRSIRRFDVDRPFYPWLRRIVQNLCLNHLKRQRRVRHVSLEERMESGFDLPDWRPDSGEQAQTAEFRVLFERTLRELPAGQQEVIRLRHYMDLSYIEMAQYLDVPLGTVMSRLHTARKSLCKKLTAVGIADELGPARQTTAV